MTKAAPAAQLKDLPTARKNQDRDRDYGQPERYGYSSARSDPAGHLGEGALRTCHVQAPDPGR
jgi:hypothetical protein